MAKRTIGILALSAVRTRIGAQHHSTCLRRHGTGMRIRTSLVGAAYAELANLHRGWFFRHDSFVHERSVAHHCARWSGANGVAANFLLWLGADTSMTVRFRLLQNSE